MQYAEADEQPCAPHDNLCYVLSHHFARAHILQILFAEVDVEQFQAQFVEVFEQEIESQNLKDAGETEPEILHVDEVTGEDCQCEFAQIEHIGSHVYAQRNGSQHKNGEQNLVDKAEEPCLCDGIAVDAVAVAVFLHPSGNAGNGEDTRKLHDPPDEQLHAEQRVSNPRTDGARDENGQ